MPCLFFENIIHSKEEWPVCVPLELINIKFVSQYSTLHAQPVAQQCKQRVVSALQFVIYVVVKKIIGDKVSTMIQAL